MFVTPYQNSANLAGFLTRSIVPEAKPNGEYWTFGVYVVETGALLHQSYELTSQDLARLRVLIRVRINQRYRLRFKLTKVRFRHGRSVSTSARMSTGGSVWTSPNGKTTVSVSGSQVTKSQAAASLRLRSPGRINFPSGGSAQSPSSARPSPETITQPYLNVVELQDPRIIPSNYGITVTPASYIGYQRIWTGVRTPGYWSLKKKQLPVNPHTVSVKYINDGPAIHTSVDDRGPWSSETSIYTKHYSGAGSPVHLPQARNKAIRKLIDDAQLGIEANLAQDFAQVGQTVNIIGSTIRRITGSITSLRHGNVTRAAEHLFGSSRHKYRKGKGPSASKSLADNWLELQYGWKPLLNDIHGTLQSLSSLQGSSDFVNSATSSSSHTTQSSSPVLHYQLPQAGPIGNKTIVTKTVCRLGLRYKIDDHLKSFMAQTGFTNPVNLAWEVLPFSFVVDWFLPIGPFLESLSAWDGLSFSDGFQTLFTKEITAVTLNRSFISPLNSHTTVIVRAQYYSEQVKLDRSRLTSFPAMTFPSFKNGLESVTHALNGLALLKSVFGRS